MLSITRRSVFMQFCRTFVDVAAAAVAPELDGDAPSERASFPSGEMNGLSELIIVCAAVMAAVIVCHRCDRIFVFVAF